MKTIEEIITELDKILTGKINCNPSLIDEIRAHRANLISEAFKADHISSVQLDNFAFKYRGIIPNSTNEFVQNMRESGINLPGIVHAEAQIPVLLSHLLAPCINSAEDNKILKHIPKVTITNILGYIGVDNAIEMCECPQYTT